MFLERGAVLRSDFKCGAGSEGIVGGAEARGKETEQRRGRCG